MPFRLPLKPITRLKMKAILHVAHTLNWWESRFIASIKDHFFLTPKQKNAVDDLYLQRVKGRYTGPLTNGCGGDPSEGYDEIHWKD